MKIGVDYYPEKPSSRKWLYAVIGLLAAVLVGGGIVAYNKLSNDNENSPAATTDSTSVDGGQTPRVNPTQIPDGDYCYEGHWKSQKHVAQACRMVFAKQGNRPAYRLNRKRQTALRGKNQWQRLGYRPPAVRP